jgi:hypothetical protein
LEIEQTQTKETYMWVAILGAFIVYMFWLDCRKSACIRELVAVNEGLRNQLETYIPRRKNEY